jgi:hypothetical protein
LIESVDRLIAEVDEAVLDSFVFSLGGGLHIQS